MTIKDLSKYHNIKLEIMQIEENIRDIEKTTIGSSKITGSSHGTGNKIDNPTERIGIKLAKLKNKLLRKSEKLLDEHNKIEDFLNKVDDSEIRIIIRKRFLEGKSWEKVGRETDSDRSTPYYKLKKYLERIEL